MELKSLTQQSECAGVEFGCLRILSECLDSSSMRLGVPFIAPRQLGAFEDQQGRLSLPSVEWRTGQSGARSPSKNGIFDRCSSDHWSSPHVARRLRGRPLVQATVGSSDSPVNYSHVAPLLFPRATSSPRMTHRTVR
ncbi:uncharacterized protein LOC100383038 [Zea mays]|jgi:hypothetical protein|uniref:Uncharacterized protein n=1 Tax=Zea mays TaxID=4577 RepID=C0PCJ4_MAIZE|nr:uncharacterized protein LOC100383038 [Zea mays]ACN31889.1 unknown [Zea mays]|eukprot:NP_001169186.1 uncharacterized protein LOC100383038 [Zea mays]